MKSEPRAIVLVAEDHPVNQKVMGLLLTHLGVESKMVGSGREAIEAATANDFALILMDIMMPDIDGFEASFAIRRLEFGKGTRTPILACTALDIDKIKEQCIRSGIDDFLSKPISKEGLISKIELWSRLQITPQSMTAEMESQVHRLRKSVDDQEPIDSRALKILYGLEQLDDILALFMAVTEALLAQLESAIHNKDVAAVRRMAHEIKGSSYAVSAKEMSELCLNLEKAGEEANWNEAEKLYAALGLAFARVREFLLNKQRILHDQLDKAS